MNRKGRTWSFDMTQDYEEYGYMSTMNIDEDDLGLFEEDVGFEGSDGQDDSYYTCIDGLGGCVMEGIDQGGAIGADKIMNMRIVGSMKIDTNMPSFVFENVIFEEGSALRFEGEAEEIVFIDCGFNSAFSVDLASESEMSVEGHCYFVDSEIVEEEEEPEESGWGGPLAALALATVADALGRKKVVVQEQRVEKC